MYSIIRQPSLERQSERKHLSSFGTATTEVKPKQTLYCFKALTSWQVTFFFIWFQWKSEYRVFSVPYWSLTILCFGTHVPFCFTTSLKQMFFSSMWVMILLNQCNPSGPFLQSLSIHLPADFHIFNILILSSHDHTNSIYSFWSLLQFIWSCFPRNLSH